jgi:protein-S-isoprenylcysteine O-methyltransferase Ste14
MSDALQKLTGMLGLGVSPPAMAAIVVLLLYVVQAELRFGAKARAHRGGASDRGSTTVLSLAMLAPVLGGIIAMKGHVPFLSTPLPAWLLWPAMVSVSWTGVAASFAGLLLRLWAVLTLRTRYSRTLLIQDDQSLERKGPYRFVRHPGYLGSLLCLNGFALASGSAAATAVSLVATLWAYAYRIRSEDAMLIEAFGESYETYRREVRALLPFIRPSAGR